MSINPPIIRIEFEHMKHTLLKALTEYQAGIDTSIREAVKLFCTTENLRCIIHAHVSRVLEGAIREEVERFFRYGEGRRAVAEAVRAKLLSEIDGTGE